MKTEFVLATALVFFFATSALASDYKVGSVEIANPWSRATPKGTHTAGGYVTIKNIGATPDRLVGGSVEIASRFQMHAMTMDQGVAKMRELKSVEIKPGETIEFKPGASHIMFVNLKRQLNKGEHVKGTLIFERAGTIQIEDAVEGIGAQSSGHNVEPMQHQ